MKRYRWSRGEKNQKLKRMGRARARASKKEKKKFLGGGIERNGDSGNQRGITEKLEDKEEKSIEIRRKSD